MAKRSALDLLKRILLSFRRNWGLKLVSLLFALILWNYVIGVVNPVRTVTFTNVPVSVSSDALQQLKNSGLAISGDINKNLKSVTVQADISRSDVSLYSKNDIHVVADFSRVTHAGQVDIILTASMPQKTKNPVTVKSPLPQSVKVTIENREKRFVPVDYEFSGTRPANYWVGEPEINPPTLQISGPSANVKLVNRAIVQIDLTNAAGDISRVRDFVLLDSSNNVLDAGSLGLETDKPNCIVNLQVFPIKTVKLSAMASLNGSPAKGYEVVGDPVVEPSAITIAGPQDTLNAIGDTLPLGIIDIGGLKSNFSHPMTPTLPKGVIFIGPNTVQVLVNIGLIMTKVTINDVRVTIVGLDSGLKVDKTFTVNATITCPQLYASNIRRSQLHVTADATGFGAGAHTLQVQASYSDPDADVSDIVTDPAEIAVKLTSASATGG